MKNEYTNVLKELEEKYDCPVSIILPESVNHFKENISKAVIQDIKERRKTARQKTIYKRRRVRKIRLH